MRRDLKAVVLGAALAALALPAAAQTGCAPEKLVRLTIRNTTPGLSAADPAAQPRSLWRLGPRFLRSEEPPDPARNGAKRLIIIAEPDIWTINITDRTGRHAVDPGPILEVHAPILPPSADVPPPFRGLEYGCELAFVQAFAPQVERTLPWGDTTAALHVMRAGDQTLAFMVDARRQEPLMISYLRGERPVFVLRYDAYRADLPPREDLFAPPGKITMTEAPATTPPPAKDFR